MARLRGEVEKVEAVAELAVDFHLFVFLDFHIYGNPEIYIDS